MKSGKTFSSTNSVVEQMPVRPRLVKAAELEARRVAAETAPVQTPKVAPILRRAPRGEAEARQMFDLLFEAA